MPTPFKGEPTKEQKEDPRYIIGVKDEAHLVSVAEKNGLKDEEIGAFAVVVIADVPSELQTEVKPAVMESGQVVSPAELKSEWSTFTEAELIEEAKKSPALFYDQEFHRLIATAPPTPPNPFKGSQ